MHVLRVPIQTLGWGIRRVTYLYQLYYLLTIPMVVSMDYDRQNYSTIKFSIHFHFKFIQIQTTGMLDE